MQMLGHKLAKNSHGRRFSTVGQGNERKVCALVQRRSDGQLHQATVGDGFTRGADEAEEHRVTAVYRV